MYCECKDEWAQVPASKELPPTRGRKTSNRQEQLKDDRGFMETKERAFQNHISFLLGGESPRKGYTEKMTRTKEPRENHTCIMGL